MRFSALAAIGVVLAAGCTGGSFGSRGDEPIVPSPSPRPTFGATTSLQKAPPAISGGTLLVTADGVHAVAADPDRDRIVIVDTATGTTRAIALGENDEPGRVIDSDPPGRAHVVLRRGGAIVTVDLNSASIVARHAVCPSPRGIAQLGHQLFVACAGGEFVGLSSDTGEVVLQKNLGRDLRDVVAISGTLRVSRFRSAEVLTVSTDGVVRASMRAPTRPLISAAGQAESEVAWRLFPIWSNRALMVHQRARDPNAAPIPTSPGGYSDAEQNTMDSARPQRCGLGIVHSALTVFDEFGSASGTPSLSDAVLPVDAALHHTGEVAVVAAGNGHTPQLGSVLRYPALNDKTGFGECLVPSLRITPGGQPIAVAYAGDVLFVQTREPARLLRYDLEGKELSSVELGGEPREDTGHAIFHSNAGGFMACASCHPEGSDDGHVWAFADLGPRRTQNLRGGVTGTEPFHWNGELHDLTALTGEVFAKRMSGETLSPDRVQALSRWIDAIPLLPVTKGDPERVARGRAVFEDATVGCATCHTGPRLTNNTSVDVGTGGVFQVPSLLGIADRAPFMHTGCALTLEDRFAVSCGGDARHGRVEHLSSEQRADLVAYLESL